MTSSLVFGEEDHPTPITFPTWQRNTIMNYQFTQMNAKNKRKFFTCLRDEIDTSNSICSNRYFPQFGVTVGDFAVMQQLLATTRGKSDSSKQVEDASDRRGNIVRLP